MTSKIPVMSPVEQPILVEVREHEGRQHPSPQKIRTPAAPEGNDSEHTVIA